MPRPTTTNPLEILAYDLAVNYVLVSFNRDEESDLTKLEEYIRSLKNVKTDALKKEVVTRNIVVLGAGASKAGFPNIFPSGPDAAALIEKSLEYDKIKDDPNIKSRIKEIEEKLFLGRPELEKSFETRLSILSNFYTVDAIRTQIDKYFSYRAFPSLFNEILAHLLKNRIIEAVINFNFDETFDQALIEEIGVGQLSRVISDGDCMNYHDLLEDDKLRMPLYIKPHGTYSEKSSLRFTKEQYIDIPSDIDKFLRELFSGVSIRDSSNSKAIKANNQFDELNLIVFGFEMESVEFNNSIKNLIKDIAYFNWTLKVLQDNKKSLNISENGNYIIDSMKDRKINIYFFQYQSNGEYKKAKKDTPKIRLANEFNVNIDINFSNNDELYFNSFFETFFSYYKKQNKLNIYFTKQDELQIKMLFSNQSSKDIKDLTSKKENPQSSYKFYIIERKNKKSIFKLDEKIQEIYNIFKRYFKEDAKKDTDKDTFCPKNLTRHELVLDFFKNKIIDVVERKNLEKRHFFLEEKQKLYFDNSDYFLDRLKFEILVVASKNNGYIQLEESLKGNNRIGIYYQKYYDTHIKADSINMILSGMGFKEREMSYNRGIYWLNPGFTEDIKDTSIKEQISKLCKYLGHNEEDIKKILEHFKDFNSQRGINIYPNFNDSSLLIFEGIDKKNIVSTDLFFHDKKVKGFTEADLILIINDDYRGLNKYTHCFSKNEKQKLIKSILAKPIPIDEHTNSEEQKLIKSILAEPVPVGEHTNSGLSSKYNEIKDKNKDRYILNFKDQEPSNNLKEVWLPFNEHSRHMVVFLKWKDKDKKDAIDYANSSALYYYKRGLTNNVNVLYFGEKDDPKHLENNLDALMDTFLISWLKGAYYTENEVIPFLTKEDAKKLIGMDSASTLVGLKEEYIDTDIKNLCKFIWELNN